MSYGDPERVFTEQSNGEGGKVSAHVVTDDTAGEIVTTDGRTRQVKAGDVLVNTGRPDVYEVHDAKAWKDGGWGEGVKADARDDDSDDDEPSVLFDPSAHNAREVREYLSRDDVSDDEKARVRSTERANMNRSSAFPS